MVSPFTLPAPSITELTPSSLDTSERWLALSLDSLLSLESWLQGELRLVCLEMELSSLRRQVERSVLLR